MQKSVMATKADDRVLGFAWGKNRQKFSSKGYPDIPINFKEVFGKKFSVSVEELAAWQFRAFGQKVVSYQQGTFLSSLKVCRPYYLYYFLLSMPTIALTFKTYTLWMN